MISPQRNTEKMQPQGTQSSIENTEGIIREYDFTTEKHLPAASRQRNRIKRSCNHREHRVVLRTQRE